MYTMKDDDQGTVRQPMDVIRSGLIEALRVSQTIIEQLSPSRSWRFVHKTNKKKERARVEGGERVRVTSTSRDIGR